MYFQTTFSDIQTMGLIVVIIVVIIIPVAILAMVVFVFSVTFFMVVVIVVFIAITTIAVVVVVAVTVFVLVSIFWFIFIAVGVGVTRQTAGNSAYNGTFVSLPTAAQSCACGRAGDGGFFPVFSPRACASMAGRLRLAASNTAMIGFIVMNSSFCESRLCRSILIIISPLFTFRPPVEKLA